MAQSCVFCGNQVVWADVMATREGMRVADIADSRGLLALEEKQQYIHMGMVCAPCCGDPASVLGDDFEEGPECWACGHRTVVLHTATPAPRCEICNSGVCDHVWEDES